jgi:Porin subfamily
MKHALATLAGLLAALPVFAGEGDGDFAASKGAGAEAQLHERLRAAVRTLPGTDTQFLIGGYIQVDGLLTRKRQEGEEQSTFFASSSPFGPAGNDRGLSVRQSQINWISRTPMEAGRISTRIEANLFPLTGKTELELNQAFVSWDDHLVVGKTYSTFMDDEALPTTLDYNGPGGVTFVRQLLARGTLKLGSGWALDAAVEKPQADLSAGNGVLGVKSSAERPDFAARVRHESEGGHLQLAGLSRRVSAVFTGPSVRKERSFDGTGVSLSGSLSVLEDDSLLFQAATGKGIGRYFNDPLSATGLALQSDGKLDLVRTTGATLYYQRKWAPDWMTVAGASTLWLSDDGLRPPDALRRINYASVNLIHRVTPTLLIGAEGLWGKAISVDEGSATNRRLQVSVRYLIF